MKTVRIKVDSASSVREVLENIGLGVAFLVCVPFLLCFGLPLFFLYTVGENARGTLTR
jgi:hypothetical protein